MPYSYPRDVRTSPDVRTLYFSYLIELDLNFSHTSTYTMQAAFSEKRLSTQKSYRKVADAFEIPSSTHHDRSTGKHASPGERVHRSLSIPQEDALIEKTNSCANRGTLLTPAHISNLAKALCDHEMGVHWTTRFLSRHKSRVSSKFYRIQEAARLKADNLENRQAFYALVSVHPCFSIDVSRSKY